MCQNMKNLFIFEKPMKNLIVIIFFICKSLHGQNLVPNPSFEDTVACPNGPGEIYYANHWYTPTDGSPDYYNSCNETSSFSVPENWFGVQGARTGNAYAGLGVFFNSFAQNAREYIQIQLNDNLQANEKYIISFYVSKADSAPILATKLGAYLSATALTQTGEGFINVNPDIESQTGYYLSDNNNWIEITDTITASGGENFLTIGFFYDDTSADTLRVFHTNNGFVTDYDGYYYIDDISITHDTVLGIGENNEKVNDFLIYPIPADNQFHIKSTIQIERIEILNQNLNLVKVFNEREVYDVSELNSGLYYLKLSFKNNKVSFKKLIINKK